MQNVMSDWVYKGEIVRVVDGDTCILDLDMGMRIWQKHVRVRIAKIDAPELSTAEGKAAKTYIEGMVSIGQSVVVTSHAFDKYGRLLASISWADGLDWANLMLASNNAVPYGGG